MFSGELSRGENRRGNCCGGKNRRGEMSRGEMTWTRKTGMRSVGDSRNVSKNSAKVRQETIISMGSFHARANKFRKIIALLGDENSNFIQTHRVLFEFTHLPPILTFQVSENIIRRQN